MNRQLVRYLLLRSICEKPDRSIKDSENYLLISDLVEEGEIDQLQEDQLNELNDWLCELGARSFRDLQHLQTIADLIERTYLAKQGKGPGLDLMDGNHLVDWLAQCIDNKESFTFITDPGFQEELNAIDMNEVYKEIVRKP